MLLKCILNKITLFLHLVLHNSTVQSEYLDKFTKLFYIKQKISLKNLKLNISEEDSDPYFFLIV